MSKFKLGGPGMVITAAFIGPGTVTMCTLAGAGHGLQLLWAVLLSTILTIFFQEMASRLGIITQLDLTRLIRQQLISPVVRFSVLAVILSAIVIGNGAYEAGNLSGGALGVNALFPDAFGSFTPIIIGAIALALLWFGNHKTLTMSLTILVIFMSISFVVAAVLVQPDFSKLFGGLFIPKIPGDSMILVLGVVGTTVVPYNLFLHAALAKSQWRHSADLRKERKDTIRSVAIGGIVSMSIVISASALEGQDIENALDIAKGLTPVFGAGAKYLIAIGLFAAGVTSAITAPLAASYVLTGVFGLDSDAKSRAFRMTWMSILAIGVLFSSIGYQPIALIRFAQVANGLILPVIAILLVWLCSKKEVLGDQSNKPLTTFIGVMLVGLLTVLGIKSILMVF